MPGQSNDELLQKFLFLEEYESSEQRPSQEEQLAHQDASQDPCLTEHR